MARKLIVLLAASAAAVLASGSSAAAEVLTRDSGQRFAPGEALVRFEPGVIAAERREARDDAGVAFESASELPRLQLVSFDGPVGAAVARLERQPGVADAQPNFAYHALAAAPNDTFFGQLWGLGATPGVGVLPAWDRTRGAGQVIAVGDTGVDLTHPDLVPNLWANPGEVAGNGLDDDGNGAVDDFRGYDFVDDDANPDDFHFHGTHVAGTAAAVADNGAGVSGVAPQAQIMAVRVLNGDGNGSSLSIANGIAYAASEGAGVINLSLGGSGNPAPDSAMGQAVSFADTRGAMVVAAAGNENNNNDASPTTPCNLPQANLICVAALTDAGALASYSNYGATSVDVGAPGGDSPGQQILSTKPSWGAPEFNEDFQAIGDWTSTTNSTAWATVGPVGDMFVTDSPGIGVNYLNNVSSQLQRTAAASLAGKRGCRLDFLLGLDIDVFGPSGELVDFVGVGVVAGAGSAGQDFAGNTGGFFEGQELSVSGLDGQPDVKATLRFTSDGSNVDDGAYVDDLKLLCRAQDYDNEIASEADHELPAAATGGGSYMAISGTSMATPHVAGVAALVRAVDPGAPPAQVVEALKNGVTPLASLSGFTVTGGAVNAVGAMDAALAIPNPVPPPPPPPPPPDPPNKVRVGSVSVNKKGVITMRLTGDRNTSGVATLTANIARASAARVVRVARKSFRIGSTGRATVKLKLSRAALKQLRRTRKLRLKAKIVLKNAAGLSSTTRGTIRLTLRRR